MTISAISASGFFLGSYGLPATTNSVTTTAQSDSVSTDTQPVAEESPAVQSGSASSATENDSAVLSNSLLALIAATRGLPASATQASQTPAPTDPLGQAILSFRKGNNPTAEASGTTSGTTAAASPTETTAASTSPTPTAETTADATSGSTEAPATPTPATYMQLPNGFRIGLFSNG